MNHFYVMFLQIKKDMVKSILRPYIQKMSTNTVKILIFRNRILFHQFYWNNWQTLLQQCQNSAFFSGGKIDIANITKNALLGLVGYGSLKEGRCRLRLNCTLYKKCVWIRMVNQNKSFSKNPENIEFYHDHI